MILYRSCARCGGDIDTTYREEPRCFQCGHRPSAMLAAPAPAPLTPAQMEAAAWFDDRRHKDNAAARRRRKGVGV